MKRFFSKLLYLLIGATATSAVFLYFFADLWKYRQVEAVMDEATKHDYNVTDYNCVDFSRDAVTKLSSKNIDSNIVVVKKDADNDKTHAVVGIWIDPQTGEFLDGAQYVGDYPTLANKYGWAK